MSDVMKSRTKDATGRCSRRLPQAMRQGKRAFTLVELLVVIAVIALLATMMFPSLGSVFGVARSTQCGSRLKEIGKAVKLLETQEGRTDMQAMFWQENVSKYLGDSKEGLICPEYAHILSMRGEDGNQEAPKPIPLKELVAFKVVKGGGTYYEDMGKGPMVAKLSDANFHRAQADNRLNNSSFANNFPRGSYEDGAEERSNPYWLCLEDHGGDWDYKDVMVKVSYTGNGYLLEAESGGTGHTNSIVTKPDHTELQRTGSNQARGTLQPIPVATTGIIASYGMNIAVPDTLDTPGSILVMDYHWLLASPDDHWSDYPDPENSSIPIFARHRERLNVLFVDGSVRMMDPHDIDPNNVYVERTYWLP